jgi:hypothetical protein
MQPLVFFAPIWADYIREFLITSIDDGISYIEARVGFLLKFSTFICPTSNIQVSLIGSNLAGICMDQMAKRTSLIANGSLHLIRL